MNFGSTAVALKISVSGLGQKSTESLISTKTELTSSNVMDENSFVNPKKVISLFCSNLHQDEFTIHTLNAVEDM